VNREKTDQKKTLTGEGNCRAKTSIQALDETRNSGGGVLSPRGNTFNQTEEETFRKITIFNRDLIHGDSS